MKKPLKLLFVLSLTTALNVVALPLTNAVPLTPCLTFFVQNGWGIGQTNQFKSDEMIDRTILVNGTNISNGHGLWAGTNIITFRYMPSYAQFYDFRLFDYKGQEVVKSEKGLAYSELPETPNRFNLYSKFKFHPIKAGDTREMFRPDDMFLITNKGVYELEVRIRICVPMTNGLPDTNAMMNLLRNTEAENFGIVESAPVRVKVIKE